MSVVSAYLGQSVDGGVAQNTVLTFGGNTAVTIAPGTVRLSDDLDFAVTSGSRYTVSFAATGNIPFSQDIGNDGLIASGNLAGLASFTGPADVTMHGLKSVSVFGPPTRIVAVLGDSIGAGMAASGLEMRFVDLSQRALGYPVVDASEGGDGVLRALERVPSDVLALPGVTDCMVEVGTNDLHREDGQFVIDGLTNIYRALSAAGIRPWGATILPKGAGVLTAGGEVAREQANAFILASPLVYGVVDFAAALADLANPSMPAAGMLAKDGIHPGNTGHQAMANILVRAFRAK
jgi:lysophospholipase L1-like esterase